MDVVSTGGGGSGDGGRFDVFVWSPAADRWVEVARWVERPTALERWRRWQGVGLAAWIRPAVAV